MEITKLELMNQICDSMIDSPDDWEIDHAQVHHKNIDLAIGYSPCLVIYKPVYITDIGLAEDRLKSCIEELKKYKLNQELQKLPNHVSDNT